MGRVRAGARPRPARPHADLAPSRSRAVLRHLLVALAALAVLGAGAVDAAGRPAPGASALTAAAASVRPAPAAARGETSTPARAATVRADALVAVPGPGGAGADLAPGSGPLVAPHLAARPVARPPTALPGGAPALTVGSRAPPGPAGT